MSIGGYFHLKSGRWSWEVIEENAADVMQLHDLSNASHKMRVRLPFTWRRMNEKELAELARNPEMRLWQDENGTEWRVADIGPGTHYFFPLHTRHLLFDSEKASSGIVEFPDPYELGNLTSDELRAFRDSIRDIAGRRKRYRKPDRTPVKQ